MHSIPHAIGIIWNIKAVTEWKYHLTVIIIIWIVFEITGFVGGRNFYSMHAIVFPVANTQYYFQSFFFLIGCILISLDLIDWNNITGC